MERQAYLRPSAAGVWSRCAGYAAINAELATSPDHDDESDNDVREDGTACHWLAAEIWEGRQRCAGDLSPNGRELTEEMFMAVDEYHDALRAWPATQPVSIEQTIAVSREFPGVADGTPDAWAFDGDTLYVADLKYGFRPVEVWRNAQLIVYAWTLVCQLTQQGDSPQQAQLTICQPRCAHRDGTTRSWTVSLSELGELAAWYVQRAQDCYAPSPMCTVNPGCRNCPAAYGCRTLQAAAGAGIGVAYDATPFVLTEPQLAYELTKLLQAQKHIEHRITGLSTQAESLLRRGKRIPGFEMGRAATRWRWRPGAEALIKRLGEMFGVEVMQEPKIKTVAKLRDAFPVDVQGMYGEKPVGELKLLQSDPNEAIKRFGK